MSLATLRDDLAKSGCNQADQVITLIEACLESGETSGTEIVTLVTDLGFNRRFVGILLRRNAGANRGRYRWYKADDGGYRLH